jgi:hypothetical protein
MGLGNLIGGIIGGNAQKKAADRAAETALKTAEMNNQLAREFKAENVGYNAPYVNRGNIAGAYLNALLGLPGAEYSTQAPAQPQQQPAPQFNPSFGNMAGGFGGNFSWLQQPQQQQPQPRQEMVTTRVGPIRANKAFNTYLNSSGYQFRVNEGENALNQGYAAQGALRSGKAQKDFMRFGQGIASDEFGRYIGYLGGQQATGLSGAGNISGVGTTALNAMTQNNNSASDARQNASLMKGQINANNWQAGGKLLDSFASSFMGGGGF